MNALLYFSIILLWGITWIAIKNQTGPVAMEVSIIYRFAIAAIILFPALWIKKIPFKYTLKQHANMMLLGMLLFSTNFIFIYHAAPYLPSGLLSIIFSSSVVMIMLNSFLFFNKPITSRMFFGALLGIMGLCCVFLPELKKFDLDNNACFGLCLALIGTYSFSLANQVSSRCHTLKIPLLASAFYGMLYGACFLALICLVKGIPFAYDSSLAYNLSLLYLAIPGSVVGFIAYLTLIQRLGAERAVYATLFFPIVALLVSTVFESFVWVLEDYIGIVMVLMGNALVMTQKGHFKVLLNVFQKRALPRVN
tara:strand:- start:20129 stop:21052 length:924 start_codon:yes stop_codon:yes gene_type:complete